MRPEDLASELGITGKALRSWLRSTYQRPQSEHGSPWQITGEQAAAARARWGGGKRSQKPATKPSRTRGRARADSDEAYVLDLCDGLLGEGARRQHTFPWLLGDPGKGGRRASLPVDGYYPDHGLVIEYRERQHFEANRHFDKPDVMTVSGVHRGEQRRIYDERREREIPRHGLELAVVASSDLNSDSRGRLRRNRADDLERLRELLAPWTE